jgi:hypothetical protein
VKPIALMDVNSLANRYLLHLFTKKFAEHLHDTRIGTNCLMPIIQYMTPPGEYHKAFAVGRGHDPPGFVTALQLPAIVTLVCSNFHLRNSPAKLRWEHSNPDCFLDAIYSKLLSLQIALMKTYPNSHLGSPARSPRQDLSVWAPSFQFILGRLAVMEREGIFRSLF